MVKLHLKAARRHRLAMILAGHPRGRRKVQMIMTSASNSGDDGFASWLAHRFPPRRMAAKSSIVFLSACNQTLLILRLMQLKLKLPCLETGALLPW
jgi:hypothetical protein